ncbi:U-box domain-containing protein [Drosera capensis]
MRDGAAIKIAFKFQCVTWKLKKGLCNIPFEGFGISEEVKEQVQSECMLDQERSSEMVWLGVIGC